MVKVVQQGHILIGTGALHAACHVKGCTVAQCVHQACMGTVPVPGCEDMDQHQPVRWAGWQAHVIAQKHIKTTRPWEEAPGDGAHLPSVKGLAGWMLPTHGRDVGVLQVAPFLVADAMQVVAVRDERISGKAGMAPVLFMSDLKYRHQKRPIQPWVMRTPMPVDWWTISRRAGNEMSGKFNDSPVIGFKPSPVWALAWELKRSGHSARSEALGFWIDRGILGSMWVNKSVIGRDGQRKRWVSSCAG